MSEEKQNVEPEVEAERIMGIMKENIKARKSKVPTVSELYNNYKAYESQRLQSLTDNIIIDLNKSIKDGVITENLAGLVSAANKTEAVEICRKLGEYGLTCLIKGNNLMNYEVGYKCGTDDYMSMNKKRVEKGDDVCTITKADIGPEHTDKNGRSYFKQMDISDIVKLIIMEGNDDKEDKEDKE